MIMKIFRCCTPRLGHRKETYLGHWYADDADEARSLALGYAEQRYGAPYTKQVEAVIGVGADKCFNADPMDFTKRKEPEHR
jgi:hypothetical protein